MKSTDVLRPFEKKVYVQRRRSYLSKISKPLKPSVTLIWSGSEVARNSTSHFAFRANSDFLYFTGFSEPDCLLVMECFEGRQRTSLFLRDRDLSPNRGSEVWEGERVGVARAPRFLGVDRAFDVSKIDGELPEILSHYETLYWKLGVYSDWDKKLIEMNQSILRTRRGARGVVAWMDPSPVAHAMRKKKSSEEVQAMRRSAEAAARGHIRAMQMIRPGMLEGELVAEVEREFRKAGSQAPAYTTICAAGDHACTLHYHGTSGRLKSGELLLLDAGAEIDGYASDITRTFPASERFTSVQREVYSWVLKAQEAAIRSVKPGVSWMKPHESALKVLSEGLSKMRIIKASPQKVYKQKLYRAFMPHGTSHWLGLDVHDVGDYYDEKMKPLKLEAGNVMTIEPGLYFRSDDRRVPKAYRGIGIRIEDDVLVTSRGYEVLSQACPKSIDEIEAIRAPRL